MTVVRSIQTILFTDIVGSTQRLATLGDRAWRDVRAGHHATVRKELRTFGGREVSTAGDGFLALFDNPADAIRCAHAIGHGVRELGLELRAGVHLGEVESGEDVGGLAVHIGARVAGAAAPGEVWVSSTVRDAEAGSGFLFEDRGAYELKGVPGEWRLFAATGVPRAEDFHPERRPARAMGPGALDPIRWGRRPTSRTLAAAAAVLIVAAAVFAWIRTQGGAAGPVVAVAGSAGPGIAVLPFIVNDPELGPWREGMVDLLSTNLDGAAGLRAIDSRTTLARWRETASGDEPRPLEAALGVARRTGARYALAGSAVEIGSRVRLAADVFDLKDGSRLGQARVEGSPDSVFALVDRLSIDVLRTVLRSPREEFPRVRLASVTTESLPALRAYLEGEVAFRRSDWDTASEAYERAVEADSAFALALQRLGHVYGWSEGIRSDLVSGNQERAWRHADRLPARERLLLESDLAVDRGDLGAFALLRSATREYPDDPAAWYLLGDAIYHLGPEALATKRDAVRALEESIRLDPGFSPAYIHLLQLGIEHPADSARVTRLLEVRARQTPGLREDDALTYAVAVAFGDTATRAAAYAELAQRPARTTMDVVHSLGQPRFADVLWTPLRLHGRVGDGVGEHLLLHEAMLHIARGRVGEAVRIVDRLASTETREPAISLLHVAHVHGVPMPPRGVELMRAAAGADTASAQLAFHAAVLAADEERWAEHAAALERLGAWRLAAVARGDSSRARFLDATAAALKGYAAWREGRPEAALRVLQAAQREAVEITVPGSGVNPVLRWWLGTLLVELGRPGEAEPYFASFWDDPMAASRLARIYEELNEPERAREAWATFAELWRDADPELQPRVMEARSAVQRLTSAVRE